MYPAITNQHWTDGLKLGSFITEASDLQVKPTDPWSRPLADDLTPERDSEGDITKWTTTVTINGLEARLTIYND